MEEHRQCPRCEEPILGWPAISRRDNATEICSECGIAESMEDMGYAIWRGEIYWRKESEVKHGL